MKIRHLHTLFLVLLMAFAISYAIAMPYLQDDKSRRRPPANEQGQKNGTTRDGKDKKAVVSSSSQTGANALVIEDDSIPDSLLHPRWKIQRTIPITNDDLNQNALDLKRPDNLSLLEVYNDTIDRYVFGNKIGNTWIGSPIMMTPEEYAAWSEKKARAAYYRKQNSDIFQAKGKEKFDFSDMHFDLGPAEKIFGPGGVRIRTQGTAELKMGATLKNIDNPSLPINNRKTTTMVFDEKINLNVNGKVGDKVNMNLNYNTDATFDYDAQNMKLKYEGKEDEIIKLVEGGNVSFPSNSSLITGASSLFGLRTDLQFGKLKLQTVVSQKKSSSSSVSSKGGVQLTTFDIDAANYEENRHFFLGQYFRDKYDGAMKNLPNLTTGVTISRVEVWVTNKTGNTTDTRDIVALTDLGESNKTSNTQWGKSGIAMPPANSTNSEYATVSGLSAVRDIDQASTALEGQQLTGGTDFEKIESARLLSSSEYTVNTSLGYISLKTNLQSDQVLAIAYEYTYNGQTYQVGEFASDITDTKEALIVKSLKNTSNNPAQGNWDLMMKNVYNLGSTVEKEKFRLDVKYQSDTTGVYLTYIPETAVKNTPIIKLIGADRLDDNNTAHSNGYFDYVDGYTVSNGRVFFPAAEPFGSCIYNYLIAKGIDAATAKKYAFTELYDSTKTVAKQVAEKDKFELMGHFKGTSANVISLGAVNIPQGSVVVTAGGVKLTEGSDYSVDYNAGEVTILNQSILDAGTSVNVSLESNSDYGQMRKTMLGLNWEYDFSKDFQISGTLQHLSEQALTTKVTMGSEPLNNTLWGFNLNWKKESQWLTNMLDKIPFLHLTAPSQISFKGEFAQLIAGQASGVQDKASYIDDFENTTNAIDVSTPSSWIISSVPSMFSEQSDKTTLASGYNRSLLAWYKIDPLFTRRSSSLTPSHIKSDLQQLSDYRVREVYTRELYPDKDVSSYGSTSTLSILNMAFYPSERGPYNFSTDNLQADGTFSNPTRRWGGMMRRLETSDFETSNIEYIEFWLMDPFVYSNKQGDASQYGGDMYFDLGEVSEDILRDGKKFYESGMSVDGSNSYTQTQWGKIPTTTTVTYAFATTSGSRALQDVGYNGLTDTEEQSFYSSYLNKAKTLLNDSASEALTKDPAGDDYHYFRGSDYDKAKTSILNRYKRINNPQGNSPDSENRSESYDTSYKTTPDVEDINQDYTLNEYEKYYQYHVDLRPSNMNVGTGFIVDKRETYPSLRNGESGHVTWYKFRIPVEDFESKVGGISDFSSIRFMRIFLTGFEKPIVLRFANLDLVRGEWRSYDQTLDVGGTGTMVASNVNIEENGDKTPVNYTLPPGIKRGQDPTNPQLVEDNEQALSLTVNDLSSNESKAVYKNTTLDLRQYKKIQMFAHANALEENTTNLESGQLAVFVRLGSDYKSNYYEYEIPLQLTPAGTYNGSSTSGRLAVWPEENMLSIPLSVFTDLKKERNKMKALGMASYVTKYSEYDSDNPANKVSVMGNPTLGEVKTMMIGIRNKTGDLKSGEVWVNEFRLLGYNNNGGWAANAQLDLQLSDLGSVSANGKYVTEGFGGLEDGVSSRQQDTEGEYHITTSLELGKFFPDKAKVSIPLYYSYNKQTSVPKYNPFDTDMKLDDALDACASEQERDSLKSIAITKTTDTNFSLSGVRVGIATKRHPMPYDPANFSFSYSHSHHYATGETTVYEKEDNWKGDLNYNWVPNFKTWEPFRSLKNKSKWLDILKRFGLNWMPQNVSFNSDMTRNYTELQERDMEGSEITNLPLTWSEQFLWNRSFNLRWDFTKNLHVSFQSATNAQIEEPYTPVNKNLYPDHYSAWKDSVWQSIKRFGTPLTYNQAFTLSYQAPINLIPVFDWVNADGNYNANYNWARGTELEDGSTLGNTITNNREVSVNSSLNFEKLYNHVPFLKEVNEKFDKASSRSQQLREKKEKEQKKSDAIKQKEVEDRARKEALETGKDPEEAVKKVREAAKAEKQKKVVLPKNQQSFEREITLRPDTTLRINHNKHSKRLIVTAKTQDGKLLKIKYKRMTDDQIMIFSQVDTVTKVKLMVTKKDPLDDKPWYKFAQSATRFLMMVRSANISYRNQYTMTLPGFMPNVGDFFGQTRGTSVMSPGLDFAFGLTGDSYIQKAADQGWLLNADTISTPATTSRTEDLQIKLTLEPVKNLKIDLNATRVVTKAKSIEYMYAGMPTTQSGTFQMTTISLKSAFESMGDASNGFYSKSFSQFCSALESYQSRIEARYSGTMYPSSSSLANGKYDGTSYGGVDKYSAEVMIPAFLSTYTSSGSGKLDLFPALARLLPNWSLRYSGLVKLPWFRDMFKSFNINHNYQSIFSVGSYSSYSTYMENDIGLGFVTDATTGYPIPSSMFNISSVTLRETFSPLLGVDMTFNNNMTAKLQYNTSRTLNLSMTSVQVNEASSHDWVLGLGYRLNNFNLFSLTKHRTVKSNQNGNNNNNNSNRNNKQNSNDANHSLNVSLDLSYRKQAAICRDIQTVTSSASSGNSAFKLSFMADYTLSKLMTLSFYYDRQTNTPLLSSSSYPTTTDDFGLSLKFSLTR